MRVTNPTNPNRPIPRCPPLQVPGPKKPHRVTFTIATVNDDFTDRKTNLRDVNAAVVMVQEAKNTDVRKVRPGDKFGVHQNTARADQAGTAMLWDKERVKAGKRGYAVGVKPQGAQMLERWINFTDVNVDGAKVRMVSVHRPPKRFARLWPDFDRNLAAFVKKSPLPVIIGMDANQANPRRLAHLTGLKWHAPKGSIDGFLATRGIRFESMRTLPKGTSDHHPLKAKISIAPRLMK